MDTAILQRGLLHLVRAFRFGLARLISSACQIKRAVLARWRNVLGPPHRRDYGNHKIKALPLSRLQIE